MGKGGRVKGGGNGEGLRVGGKWKGYGWEKGEVLRVGKRGGVKGGKMGGLMMMKTWKS